MAWTLKTNGNWFQVKASAYDLSTLRGELASLARAVEGLIAGQRDAVAEAQEAHAKRVAAEIAEECAEDEVVWPVDKYGHTWEPLGATAPFAEDFEPATPSNVFRGMTPAAPRALPLAYTAAKEACETETGPTITGRSTEGKGTVQIPVSEIERIRRGETDGPEI